MSVDFNHISVLLEEVVAHVPTDGELWCADGTLGGGGHAHAILSRRANVKAYLGVDRDAVARHAAGERLAEFGARCRIEAARYSELPEVWRRLYPTQKPNVLLVDLGVSSPQLDHAERGFAFSRPGPLDMRMGDGMTLLDKLHSVDETSLADILYNYGEERMSRRIAPAILAALPALKTTTDLANVIRRIVKPEARGIDPATRSFQALRIWVNNELGELESLLNDCAELMADDGVAMFISFHSLEDRAVKQFLAEASRDCICPPRVPMCVCQHRRTFEVLTKKPLTASEAELQNNPRSRSAKLRIGRRVPRTKSGA